MVAPRSRARAPTAGRRSSRSGSSPSSGSPYSWGPSHECSAARRGWRDACSDLVEQACRDLGRRTYRPRVAFLRPAVRHTHAWPARKARVAARTLHRADQDLRAWARLNEPADAAVCAWALSPRQPAFGEHTHGLTRLERLDGPVEGAGIPLPPPDRDLADAREDRPEPR